MASYCQLLKCMNSNITIIQLYTIRHRLTVSWNIIIYTDIIRYTCIFTGTYCSHWNISVSGKIGHETSQGQVPSLKSPRCHNSPWLHVGSKLLLGTWQSHCVETTWHSMALHGTWLPWCYTLTANWQQTYANFPVWQLFHHFHPTLQKLVPLELSNLWAECKVFSMSEGWHHESRKTRNTICRVLEELSMST